MQLQPAFHLIDREDDKLFPTKAQSSQSNILFVAFVPLWEKIHGIHQEVYTQTCSISRIFAIQKIKNESNEVWWHQCW